MHVFIGFTVRKRPAVLVAPAAPTPRELKRLSVFDEQDSMRFQISNLHFYRRDESRGGKDPVRVIQEALAKALHDGWKLAVDYTGEADADVGLEHFGDPLLPPFPCIEELIFDLTRLTCGGFILAVRVNHTMADALGLMQFLSAVAELARGAQTPSVPLVWKREQLSGRNQQQSALGHDKLHEVPGSDTDTLRLHYFFFGPREIAAIRAQLPPHLQKRATKFPPHLQKRATKFDTIAGWIWKFRTVALAPKPNEVMLLEMRSCAPVAMSTAGELCTNPLSYAVELVKKAKNQVDMEYIRSTADLGPVWGKRRPITAGLFSLSDATRARFDNLDFGWGKPVYGGAAEAVGVPSIPWVTSFLLASKNANGEDAILAPMCLPGPAMDRLVEEMSKLLRLTADVTLLHQPHVFPVKRSAL
ncbi:hypothetical protein PVAP13_3KG408801 [Panicum virgatum]|uniref:Uncharacterized protein n=1 Tax=Panicum virgatum TaxID=38727 RepID=A0A8T0V3E0_PANVG|nr:hypothetical protein PVAP13_3KG408801 [Panicum virgatum]